MHRICLLSFALLAFACSSIWGTAASAATDAQVQACRNRVIQAYPGTQAYNVGITEVWMSNGSARLDWYAGNNRQGTCVIGQRNEVYQFIDNGQTVAPQPPPPGWNPLPGQPNPIPNTQNFGNVPGVGQFAAVHNTGRFANGVVTFQAYVNGTGPNQFGATCASGRLHFGQGGLIQDTPQARYVVGYVCNGGPPTMGQNGTVGFGHVPGIGQFNVVNGSGVSGGPSMVSFRAYVNGAGPQQWLAACATGLLGQNGSWVEYSAQAQYVVSYICSGGPPGGAWAR